MIYVSIMNLYVGILLMVFRITSRFSWVSLRQEVPHHPLRRNRFPGSRFSERGQRKDGRGVGLISIQLLYEIFANAMKYDNHATWTFSVQPKFP